jgi:acyl-CoA thioesterase-1
MRFLIFLSAYLLVHPPGLISQVNLNFEKGLNGWTILGKDVEITRETVPGIVERSCVKLGPAFGGISQRVSTSGLRILDFQIRLRSSDSGTKAYCFARFFDSAGHQILEMRSGPYRSPQYQQGGEYAETPPFCRYVDLGVERDSSEQGIVFVDSASLSLEEGEPPRINRFAGSLDQCLHPFWSTDSVYDEAVLMYGERGQGATGRLLGEPAEILAVRSYDGQREFRLGRDYALSGRTLTRLSGSGMPFRTDSSFDKSDLAWYNLQSAWILVTYRPKQSWQGPRPFLRAPTLNRSLARLRSRSPLHIVVLGMSISRGMDVSGYDQVPPYQPTYAQLFRYGLSRQFSDHSIQLDNAGLPGATVDWGADYASVYVNPLHPDLLVIDFGMNDFWRTEPQDFARSVEKIIREVRSENPACEFLLISNMLFDPDYIIDSDPHKSWYRNNFKGYGLAMKAMQSPGIANLDMTSLTESLYQAKKAKDFLVNPLHPNDYLVRWYAQCLLALFPPDQKKNR